MKSPRSIRVALGAALACGLLAWPALALATGAKPAASGRHLQTAQSGALTATFSFVQKHDVNFGSEELTISNGGQVVYQAPVKAPQCGNMCSPGGIGNSSKSVTFATFAAGGSPSVVLSLFSNFAHCCSIVQVFSPGADGTWSAASYNFGDPGFGLHDLGRNGVDEFVSADDRFAYSFTDYAASGLPIEVVSYAAGQFQNVTRSYPDVIDQDARFWLRVFTRQKRNAYDDTNGIIAAWAADEDELGRSATVAGYLARQAKAGHLNAAIGTVVPQGFKFVRALKRFLVRTGYLTS